MMLEGRARRPGVISAVRPGSEQAMMGGNQLARRESTCAFGDGAWAPGDEVWLVRSDMGVRREVHAMCVVPPKLCLCNGLVCDLGADWAV